MALKPIEDSGLSTDCRSQFHLSSDRDKRSSNQFRDGLWSARRVSRYCWFSISRLLLQVISYPNSSGIWVGTRQKFLLTGYRICDASRCASVKYLALNRVSTGILQLMFKLDKALNRYLNQISSFTCKRFTHRCIFPCEKSR